ncbi:glycosyltransferase family 61 protein [Ostreiculturibacter nitratireducens]|uniref:glycosyltransferase family 61 protein n=1 Tax=Ostreiculturibacter nitratireducens TaxID=3075226 RepID=UPI0031B611B9
MPFDPMKPLAPEIRIIENAIIVPFGDGRASGIQRPAGVFDADGRFVEESQCFRNSTLPTTVTPTGPAPEPEGETIPGLWLYGGMLYQHFGHFLLESTGRLWARAHVGERPEGELFLLKQRVTWPERFVRPMRPMLTLFGARRKRATGVATPVRVERLAVAPQGFGTGDMVAGSPEFRAFTKRRLRRRVTAEGAEKIYISRTRLFSKRGRYFGEAQMERLFETEGYRIFHPQEHSIEEQIAQYKAARMIVSSDSSALHLAAFFAEDGDRVGIVLRRPGNTIDDFLTQFRYFGGAEPDVIDALNGRYYQFEGAKLSQMSEIYSELDFPALGQALAERGFIRRPQHWSPISASDIDTERHDLATRLGQEIVAAEIQ